MTELKGTFACPICGQDTPHHHTPEEIARAQPTVAGVIAYCRYRAKHLRKEGSMSLDAAADILDEITKKLERVFPTEPQGVVLPKTLTGELACILEDCSPPDKQAPEAVAALIEGYQPTWDRIRSALSHPRRSTGEEK